MNYLNVFLLICAILVCCNFGALDAKRNKESCQDLCSRVRCAAPPEDCESNGGEIKKVYRKRNECVCCDTCVYTSGVNGYCAEPENQVYYQCDKGLKCKDNICVQGSSENGSGSSGSGSGSSGSSSSSSSER